MSISLIIVNIRSSLIGLHSFSCLCCCHRPYKSFLSFVSKEKKCDKVKFRQVSNHCKSILEASKLGHANEKRVSLHRNLALITSRIANSVFNKNLQYFLCLCVSRCCLLHWRRPRCLLKSFLRILILMTRVCTYLFFPLELI